MVTEVTLSEYRTMVESELADFPPDVIGQDSQPGTIRVHFTKPVSARRMAEAEEILYLNSPVYLIIKTSCAYGEVER